MAKDRTYSGRKKWTREEEEKLAMLCEKYTATKAAQIMGRSKSSVNCKRIRMGISSFTEQTDLLTASQISELTGADKASIGRTWVPKGLKQVKIGYMRLTSEEQLLRFMKNNPELWSAMKCDYYFFCRYKWFLDKLDREKKGNEKENHYRNFRKWSDYEKSKARMLLKRGLPHDEIGKLLGRSTVAINHFSIREKANV